MALLISLPILGGLAILQSAIASKMPLLLGTTDLILVAIIAWSLQDRVKAAWQWSIIGGSMMTMISGLPIGIYLSSYLGVTIIAGLIRRQIWKVPFLGMLTTVLIGTILVQTLSWISRWILGVYIPIEQVLVLILLPSVLLNLLIAVPAYFIMRDLAHRLYPDEIEA